MMMNERLGSGVAFWERGRTDRAVLVVLAMAVAGIALNQGVHSFTVSAGEGPKMKHFALLFKQGPLLLTEADQKARAEAIVAWTEDQDDAGHQLDARSLKDARAWIGADLAPASVAADDGALSSILFLEARDLAEAVEIARSHPALRYGASVEVRAWTPRPEAAVLVAPHEAAPPAPHEAAPAAQSAF